MYLVSQLGRYRSKSQINTPVSAATDETKDRINAKSDNINEDDVEDTSNMAENSSQDVTGTSNIFKQVVHLDYCRKIWIGILVV